MRRLIKFFILVSSCCVLCSCGSKQGNIVIGSNSNNDVIISNRGTNTEDTHSDDDTLSDDTNSDDEDTYSDDDTFSDGDDTFSDGDDTYSDGDDTYSDDTNSADEDTYSDDTYSADEDTYSDEEYISTNESNSRGTSDDESNSSNKDVLSRYDIINRVIEYVQCDNDIDLQCFKSSYCTKSCNIDLLSTESCVNVVVSICAEECKDNPSSYIVYFNSDYQEGSDVDYKTGILLVDVSDTKISSISVVDFE